MQSDLKRYYCEILEKEILVDIGRKGIGLSCEYYHKCFNRYSLRLNFFCSENFPENKTCQIIKLLAEERIKLMKEKSRLSK